MSFVIPSKYIDESQEKIIIDSGNGYIVSENEEKAFYYSFILNFLAYEVYLRNNRVFIRDQYARPIQATIQLDVIWEEKSWQKEVYALSKDLHEIAKLLFEDYYSKNSTAYLRELEKVPKFWRVISLIRANVINTNLSDAISFVSREGKSKGIKDAGEWRVFEAVEGIGKKTAQNIIDNFGSLEKALQTNVDELAKIKSINLDIAKKIYKNVIQKWK